MNPNETIVQEYNWNWSENTTHVRSKISKEKPFSIRMKNGEYCSNPVQRTKTSYNNRILLRTMFWPAWFNGFFLVIGGAYFSLKSGLESKVLALSSESAWSSQRSSPLQVLQMSHSLLCFKFWGSFFLEITSRFYRTSQDRAKEEVIEFGTERNPRWKEGLE